MGLGNILLAGLAILAAFLFILGSIKAFRVPLDSSARLRRSSDRRRPKKTLPAGPAESAQRRIAGGRMEPESSTHTKAPASLAARDTTPMVTPSSRVEPPQNGTPAAPGSPAMIDSGLQEKSTPVLPSTLAGRAVTSITTWRALDVQRPAEPDSVSRSASQPPSAGAETPPSELIQPAPPSGESSGHTGSAFVRPEPRPAGSHVLPRAEATPDLRPLIFTVMAVCIAAILGTFGLRGAGTLSVEPRPDSSGPTLAQQAEAMATHGDYMGAWEFYYQALQAAPEDVSLWYGLGVVLSHLNEREGAVNAFQYVVRHGDPASERVRLARQWLGRAGVLVEPVAFTAASEPVGGQGEKAALRGKVTWGPPEATRPPLRVQVLLQALNGPAEGKRFVTRVGLGESYRFEKLPAGTYRLVGAAAGHRLWELTVDVEDGKEVVLDLGKDNSNNPNATFYLQGSVLRFRTPRSWGDEWSRGLATRPPDRPGHSRGVPTRLV